MNAEDKSPAHKVAADFLRARQWIVEAIAGNSVDPADLPATVLGELLSYERCASWLLFLLTSNGFIENIPTAIEQVIRRTAERETQSAMRARVEGRELSSMATTLNIPIVVLKGGVRAITGDSPALPLVDIDILVARENVARVVTELERSGFGKALPALMHHQGISPADGRLSVEVHWTISRDGTPLEPSMWERIEPIAQTPGLFTFGNVDQLVHIVRHALLNHRQRPVTIRDALLAGITAHRCSAEETAEVRLQLRSDPNEAEALEMISFGKRLVTGAGTITDPFVGKCAIFYSAVALAPRLPRALTSGPALAFLTEIALGRVGVTYAVKNSLQWRGSDVAGAARLGEKYPRLTRPLIGLAHLGYYSVVAAVALPLLYRTRDKAINELGRRSL